MAEIVIQRVGRSRADVRIEGTAPLIVNRFDAKARQMVLDAQMGKAKQRTAKNPEANYEASLYRLPGDEAYGFPATAFKAAIVDSARYFKGSKITMTDLRQSIFVQGEGSDLLVPIEGTPKMREDVVRNTTGVIDIRHRGEFWPWSATLTVLWVRNTLAVESLVALIDAAGMGGVGEWRPASKQSKSGMYGTWQVADDQDVKEQRL